MFGSCIWNDSANYRTERFAKLLQQNNRTSELCVYEIYRNILANNIEWIYWFESVRKPLFRREGCFCDIFLWNLVFLCVVLSNRVDEMKWRDAVILYVCGTTDQKRWLFNVERNNNDRSTTVSNDDLPIAIAIDWLASNFQCQDHETTNKHNTNEGTILHNTVWQSSCGMDYTTFGMDLCANRLCSNPNRTRSLDDVCVVEAHGYKTT